MNGLQVGRHRVDRIEETFDLSFTPEEFFLGFDPEVFAANMGWLAPTHYRPDLGTLVLSLHSWLVRTDRHTVLIDACIGNGKDRMPRAHWHELNTLYLDRMRAAGVAPEEVDFVMCTHLHGDHVGWNTGLENGHWVPTFPNARYLFGRTEYDYWLNNPDPSPVRRNAFNDSVLPIIEQDRAVLVDDGYQVDDSFTVELAPGHTPGNAAIRLHDGDDQALFAGDSIHHPIQVQRAEWSTIACSDPEQSSQSRVKLLESCCEHRTLLLPAHFATPHGGRVHRDGASYRLEWLASN